LVVSIQALHDVVAAAAVVTCPPTGSDAATTATVVASRSVRILVARRIRLTCLLMRTRFQPLCTPDIARAAHGTPVVPSAGFGTLPALLRQTSVRRA
jgi:hypothetical protein